MKKYLIIILSVFLLHFGCDAPKGKSNNAYAEETVSVKSDKLTRDKAEMLIKQKYNIPGVEVKDINLGYENEHFTIERYDALESQGLMNTNHYMLVISNSSLTEEGMKYAFGGVKHDQMNGNDFIQVKVAELHFGEITGIIERAEFNLAEVEYNLVRKEITPFGRAFGLKEGIIKKNSTFIKYDDGWRIK